MQGPTDNIQEGAVVFWLTHLSCHLLLEEGEGEVPSSLLYFLADLHEVDT